MKDPYIVAVGQRLDATMKVFGITSARQLADFLGLERTQVSNWYNGVGLPPVSHVTRLCEALHLTLDWIYRGVPDGIPTGTWIRLNAALSGQPLPDGAHGVAPEGGLVIQKAAAPAKRRPAAEPAVVQADAGKADNG